MRPVRRVIDGGNTDYIQTDYLSEYVGIIANTSGTSYTVSYTRSPIGAVNNDDGTEFAINDSSVVWEDISNMTAATDKQVAVLSAVTGLRIVAVGDSTTIDVASTQAH